MSSGRGNEGEVEKGVKEDVMEEKEELLEQERRKRRIEKSMKRRELRTR